MTFRLVLVLGALALALAASGCGSATCGPQNCNGCCDATNTCLSSSDQNCGAQGAACQSCVGASHCSPTLGECIFQSGTNAGNGAATTTSNSGSGSASGSSGAASNGSAASSSGASSSTAASSGSTAASTSASSTASTSGTVGNTGGTTGSGSTTGTTGSSGTTSTTGGSVGYVRLADFVDVLGQSLDFCYRTTSGSDVGPIFASLGFPSGLSQGEVTRYLAFPDPTGGQGTAYTIDVLFAPATSCAPIQTLNLTSIGGAYQSFVVAGSAPTPFGAAFNDDTSAQGSEASIRFMNVSPSNVGTVNLLDNASHTALFSAVAYGTSSAQATLGNVGQDVNGYLPTAAGGRSFAVEQTGSTTLKDVSSVQLAASSAYTLFFTDAALLSCVDSPEVVSTSGILSTCQ